MLNKVTLMGRLVRDPELKYTPGSGTAYSKYCLAVERSYQKDKNNKEVDFINVTVWNKPAEFASQYFKKGRQVVVLGRLQTKKWTDKDGQNRTSLEVIAEEQYFADSKPAEQKGAYSQDQVDNIASEFSDGDIGFSISEEDEKNLPF